MELDYYYYYYEIAHELLKKKISSYTSKMRTWYYRDKR